jgi:5'-methylthioadenosine phosphorylase
MGRLAFISGSSLDLPELPRGDWEVVHRHVAGDGYTLPHEIDHVAAMRSILGAGCDRILALSSVGGLHRELGPGTLVCPNDFIALDAEPVTALSGPAAHRVPGFDHGWRRTAVRAVEASGASVSDGGVYWQTRGPRLETPAEIGMIAAHADVIGMTVASECVVAGELGLRYAALCVVDNLANGVAETELTLAEITENRARQRDAVARLLAAVLPALAGND